jgi:hypothetical protein
MCSPAETSENPFFFGRGMPFDFLGGYLDSGTPRRGMGNLGEVRLELIRMKMKVNRGLDS